MSPASDLYAQIGLVIAATLTLITLSYAVGDTPLFRFVLYLFIGAAAGYAAAVAVQDVVIPQLVFPILDQLSGVAQINFTDYSLRAFLSLLLLTKLFPHTARVGNPVTALLAGVGAALAVGGAVQGTLLPQIAGAATVFNLQEFQAWLQAGSYGNAILIVVQGLILLLATASTLAYFHFGARGQGNQAPIRNIFVDVLGWIGSIFIAICLASLFTGVLLSALGALIERVAFLRDIIALVVSK